jgi:ArsR family transcriptional regulator
MKEIINVFKALSDETRLRLFYILNRSDREAAVCELVDAVEESQYNVSKHLRILAAAGLIKENKSGRWVLYSLNANLPIKVNEFIAGLKKPVFDADYERLKKRLGLRRGNEIVACCIARELMVKNTGRRKK